MAEEDLSLLIPGRWLGEQLMCPVCMGQQVNSHVTACGHHFCEACIKESVDVHHRCPCCNKALTADSLTRDPLINDIIGRYNDERAMSEKRYFNNLIDQAHVDPDELHSTDDHVSFSPVETVLKEHLKRSLTAHQNYYQSLKKSYQQSVDQTKKALEDLTHGKFLFTGPSKSPQEREGELMKTLADLKEEFESCSKCIAQAYDRYLTEHIPDLAILPIRVNITILEKNIIFKAVEIKPMDTQEDVIQKILQAMETRGDKVITHNFILVDFGPFSIKSVGEMLEECTNLTAHPELQSEGRILTPGMRLVIQLGMKPGSQIAVHGPVTCQSDLPKQCFAVSFSDGTPELVDYFSCSDCNINWICRSCYESCHKGHTCAPYIMNHKATWACCYCLRKKICKLSA